ncbi:MAG TPA: hypothetical protein DCG79_01390 [Clostridiales bacterium]|nr:hypothetical protein [Clostridiales bacterium]
MFFYRHWALVILPRSFFDSFPQSFVIFEIHSRLLFLKLILFFLFVVTVLFCIFFGLFVVLLRDLVFASRAGRLRTKNAVLYRRLLAFWAFDGKTITKVMKVRKTSLKSAVKCLPSAILA